MTSDDCRTPFAEAAGAFCALVEGIRADQWSLHGLGEWDVRGLVGHTSRALSTVEAYLAEGTGEPDLHDPVDYFVAVLAEPSGDDARVRQDAAIAERGRKAGQELGDHPAGVVRELAERVVALVMATPDAAVFATPAGSMPLPAYLPTRTFELAVHGLDLARALGVAPPRGLRPGVAVSCELAGRLAARRRGAADLLMVLTGRRGVPGGVSVL